VPASSGGLAAIVVLKRTLCASPLRSCQPTSTTSVFMRGADGVVAASTTVLVSQKSVLVACPGTGAAGTTVATAA
jgi:hypothetical protein